MSAIDELRAMAESGGLEIPKAATLMMDAADTIDRLDAENAKLREELAKWERLAVGIDLPEYPVTQFKPKDLERENAKLRELIAKYSVAAKYLCGFSHCNECNLDCASVFGDVPSGWDCARMLLDKKARELGVEVGP